MTIKLQYTYLMHDIDQWTYRLAKMRITDDAVRNEAQSSGVSTDISYYRRKIEESIAQLRTMLKNRLSSKNGSGSDTLSTSASEWVISLTDGNYYCDAQAIADLMHKYVVRNTISDWALTYAPDSASAMSQEAELLRQQIINEVYTRKYPDLTDNSTNQTFYTITVNSNNTTYGTVSGGGLYLSGTQITIKAVANTGYSFEKWDDNNTNAERQVTVSANKTYTATFVSTAAG